MDYRTELQVVPTQFNLASLERVEMVGCWRLRKIPDISPDITRLTIAETMLEELPRLWSHLETLIIHGSANRSQLKVERFIKRSGADIEKITDWIKDLHGLKWLHIVSCPKLASMPELPGSLRGLIVDTCESKESDYPSIIYGVPTRKKYTCRRSEDLGKLLYRIFINGFHDDVNIICDVSKFREEHLCIRRCTLLDKEGWLEQNNEISFEFSTASKNIDVIECGVQILAEETNVCLTILESCESTLEQEHTPEQVHRPEQVPIPEQTPDKRNEFNGKDYCD
ncbi:hypothetical protein Bca4012_030884 [Brassica carinata]